MVRLTRIRMSLCALVVLVASLFLQGVVGAQPPVDDALLRDTQWYAKAQGVSLEEARRRLALQESIGLLEETLTVREARAFAGLWIQHQPDYRVIVLLTTGDPQQVAPYIAGGPLAQLVEVRGAAVPLATLRTEQETLLQRLKAFPAAVDVDINLAENQVVLRTPNPPALRQHAQQHGIALSANVKLVAGKAGFRLLDIYGGTQFYNPANAQDYCTSGFALRKLDTNEVFTSTAGHCTNTLRAANGTNLTFIGEHWTGNYDYQWHRAPGQVIRPHVFDGSSYRPIRAMRSYANQVVGEWVCKYGVVSGYNCGTIYTKAANGQFVCAQTNNGTTFGRPGDSGGPWFYGNTAYGFMWAGPEGVPTAACYMSADKVKDRGFTIHLAP